MFDFFEDIFNYIELGFGLLLNLVKGLWQFLKMIPQMLTFTTTMSAFMPSFLVAFFLAGFATAIVLVIINRRS